MSAPKVRKDGKVRRASRGLPTSHHNGLTQPSDQDRLNWHELVKPGPKGDPQKGLARAERHAASRTRVSDTIDPDPRQQAWHWGHVPTPGNGRLVQHRTRLAARSGGGIDRAAARARRRAERAAALAAEVAA